MKIVIATGGTGGHIYPALALAKHIQQQGDHQILFIGTDNHMESNLVPEHGFDFEAVKAYGIVGNPLRKVCNFLKTHFAHFHCQKILKEFDADIVIGFGGYVSYPAVIAAKKLHLPIIIHEQNSIAGKANKTLAKYAEKVVVCYKQTISEFPQGKAILLGNPRASEVDITNNNRSDLQQLGLAVDKKTVLIVMGSQGSETVNQVIEKSLPLFSSKSYQVIFVTGKKHFEQFANKQFEQVTIVPYLAVIDYLCKVDLIVSRAGATTAAEVTAAGLPSIIVPSPYVANNHQVVNASQLAQAQAALVILEQDLTTDALVSAIDSIVMDDQVLAQMSVNARLLGKPQAAAAMFQLMQEIVNK